MKSTRAHLAALLLLCLLPLALVGPSVIGGNTYVPWDIAQFAPARTLLGPEARQQVVHHNNTIITEVPVMFGPELEYIRARWQAGQLAHWNPHSRHGVPVWSSSILGLWHPPTWLVFLFEDPRDGLGILAWFAFVVAGLLMYGLLIHLGLSPLAALVGAMAFSFSGTLTVNAHFYQRINALVWLPGLLWSLSALYRAAPARRHLATLGLACCMFMTHSAGFPPYAIVISLLSAGLGAVLLIQAGRKKGARDARNFAAWAITGALLGVLLASVQTLAALAFFPESNRNLDPGLNQLAAQGYDPAGWLGLLFPSLFNHPFLNTIGQLDGEHSPLFWWLFSREYWVAQEGLPAGTAFAAHYNFCEYSVFCGVLTLPLALLGLLHRAMPLKLFALGAALGLACLAAAPAFLSWLIPLPPLRMVPAQRWVGPVCCFIAVLAAMGLHGLPDLRRLPRLLVAACCAAVAAACLALWFWARQQDPMSFGQALLPGLQDKYLPRYPALDLQSFTAEFQKRLGPNLPRALHQLQSNTLPAAVLLGGAAGLLFGLPWITRLRHGLRATQVIWGLLILVELYRFGAELNTGRVLQGRPLDQTPVHEFLREAQARSSHQGGFAVLRAHDQARRGLNPLPSQLPPDTLLNLGIRDIQAYTFVDAHSHLPFRELYGPHILNRAIWPTSIPDDPRLRRPYFDLIGVRYVLSEDELEHAGRRVGPVLRSPPSIPAVEKFYIYERDSALPRGWVVHELRSVAGGPEEMAQALVAEDLRPRAEVLVDPDTHARLAAHPAQAAGTAPRPVHFHKTHDDNRLHLSVAAGPAGYLVLHDTFMSGWTARIDGVEVPIERGNLFMRVLPLGPEASRIELSYVTPGFYPGVVLSVLAALACLILAFLPRLRRRAAPVAPQE